MAEETQIYIIGKTRRVFSRGILAKKLELLGFSITQGYEFSILIYNLLQEQGYKELTTKELNEIVTSLLKEKISKEAARKFQLVEKWRDSDIPLWILIAGAIGVGKSTISRSIANDLGIQHVVGTDIIRDVMRKILSPEIVPELHVSSYLAHKTLRPIYSARFDEVVIGFENHAKYVNMGVEAVLSRAETENVSIVIEGEHLLPSFFDELTRKRRNVIYVTVAINNAERHLENLSLQYTKEKEELIAHFSAIRKIHDYLANETKLRKLNLIEVQEGIDPILEMRKIVVNTITKLL
ncbi:MAG: hypothetical protein ACTSYD_00595 [Candidatus Heimdallarchaeaceae archaeon]